MLYNRGLTIAMMTVEAVKRAQIKYGKKPLTGEEVRWGLENLALDQARSRSSGFDGFMTPISTTLRRPRGGARGHVTAWDGKKWNVQPASTRPTSRSSSR